MKTPKWRESLYYHYYGFLFCLQGPTGLPHLRVKSSVSRTQTAKLVCYPKWKGGPFWEFFDLRQDVREMRNLYHEAARQREIDQMRKQLRALMAQYKDHAAIATLDKIESPRFIQGN